MKYCPKCKREYSEGKFCEACENEDGSPVKLMEKTLNAIMYCPQCKKEFSEGMKFCSGCGVKLTAKVAKDELKNTGVMMGDKNVIAGDIKGEEYNISGNATFITNEDESKKVSTCAVCGNITLRIKGYTCTSCGKFVCESCYDMNKRLCKSCLEENIDKFSYAMDRAFVSSKGKKLSIEQEVDLHMLAEQLKIDNETYESIKEETAAEWSYDDIPYLTETEESDYENAKELYYEDGEVDKALDLVKSAIHNHGYFFDHISNLYFLALYEKDPEAALNEISMLGEKNSLHSFFARFLIYIKENDLNSAEKLLTAIKDEDSKNPFVLPCLILHKIALFYRSGNQKWLEQADELVQKIGNPSGKLCLTLEVKVQCMLDEAKGIRPYEVTQEFCKENQIYYAFMQKKLLSK